MNRTRTPVMLLVLALLVSSCAQARPPTVANQPESTQPPVVASATGTERSTDAPSPTATAQPTTTAAAATAHVMEAATAATDAPVAASARAGVAPLLGNLGDHHHAITVVDPRAQQYFDEGLILVIGFNHAEAIRSFKDAATLDPTCAMCYWGIALALGPNINAPMEAAAVPEAYAAIQKALELAPRTSEAEQAYIQALAKRYGPEAVADRGALDMAYADAMRELARRYPDDLDAATFFGEALMDLSPWAYWTAEGEPTTYTNEILATLESVMQRNPNHPGANHYYIHAVEASSQPERAVPSAERLTHLVPGAGHLVHMPAHVYWRVGRYHDVAEANEHAIHTDEQYIPDRNAGGGFYSVAYYPHNIHFLFTAAAMEGRSQLALETAHKLVEQVGEQAYRDIPMLEDFGPMPVYAMVRFGKWEEILKEPQPKAEFQYITGGWHWAQGMAYVRLGQLDKAEEHHARLVKLAETDTMKEFTLWSFEKAGTMLAIASHVLAGEMAGARGQTDEMIAELQEAVRIQDGLAYMEPPPWYYPVRHNLGAALLEVGRGAEAEVVYRKDLQQFPNNGWSLFGLAESLRAQGKMDEAADVQKQFEAAWQYADIRLTASRY